jgi:hypothetical protein
VSVERKVGPRASARQARQATTKQRKWCLAPRYTRAGKANCCGARGLVAGWALDPPTYFAARSMWINHKLKTRPFCGPEPGWANRKSLLGAAPRLDQDTMRRSDRRTHRRLGSFARGRRPSAPNRDIWSLERWHRGDRARAAVVTEPRGHRKRGPPEGPQREHQAHEQDGARQHGSILWIGSGLLRKGPRRLPDGGLEGANRSIHGVGVRPRGPLRRPETCAGGRE